MANLIFDLMALNYGMNSMKDSSVVLQINLKKNSLRISLVSIIIFTDILMAYIYLFFVLFCIFTFVPSYDIYVYQCICCASFLTFTILIIIITVNQLV